MSKYFEPYKLLPYQRNFILVNGERSIGKTYSTLKWIYKQCKDKGVEFMYIVRTQDEKKNGVLKEAWAKVLANEYPQDEVEFTTEEMILEIDEIKQVMGYCTALSEVVKIKKRSFPNVKYFIFDEYMLESKQSTQYYNGWKEPDALLSIYHTVDREEDRVICFMLGNNTSFYNPYHMHKAFNIPSNVKKGEMWMSENVLFYWAESSEELKEDKAKCKFLQMLEGTDYGTYAKDGEYIDDNYNLVEPLTNSSRYMFTFQYMGNQFGVYSDLKEGKVYVHDKIDPSCKFIYALTIDDHKENTSLSKGGNYTQLKWFADNFKAGNVRFTSMETKVKIEKGIAIIL